MLSWFLCCEIFKALVILVFKFVLSHVCELAMILLGILFLLKFSVTFRRTVWFFYQQIAALGIGLVWSTFLLPLIWLRQRTFENILILSLIAKPLARIIGISFEIHNEDNMVAENECAVIVSNHPSKLDFLSMMYLFDNFQLVSTVIAANNVYWLGPFGWILDHCRVCFIKTKSGLPNTFKEINNIVDAAYKEKVKIWFFPEGRTSEKLLPFKKGAFWVAIDKKIPIIPVVFSPHNFIDWNTLQAEKGKIIIDILPSISTTEYTHEDMNSLIRKTHAIIGRKYEELGGEIEREGHES